MLSSADGRGLLEHRLGLAQHRLLGRGRPGLGLLGERSVGRRRHARDPTGGAPWRRRDRGRHPSLGRLAGMADTTPDSFPRASARTQRFTRGAPRSLHLDPTGERLLFVRSAHGTDPVGALWSLDVATGTETLLADPRTLLAGGDEQLSPAERARRERSREGGGGIVGFATDRDATVVAFALSSRLWVTDLEPATPASCRPSARSSTRAPTPPAPGWPTPPTAACTSCGADGSDARTLAAAEKEDVAWGVAEFVAAEEMDRYRGYWWAPGRLGRARRPGRREPGAAVVHRRPGATRRTPPAEVRYPVAGSADAEVTLHLLGLDGSRTDVEWDRVGLPLPGARLVVRRPAPSLQVMSRDQKRGARARRRPAHRGDVDAGRAVGPGLDRRRRRRTRPAAGRPARHHRRARRRPAAGRRRRAGHRHRRPGRRGAVGRRRTACCWPAPTTRSRATSGAGPRTRGVERLTGPGGYHTGAGRRRHRRGRQPAGQHARCRS